MNIKKNATVKKKKPPRTNGSVHKNGEEISQKSYVLRTYSIPPASLDVFEKTFDNMRKHALKNRMKPPSKSDILSALFKMSPTVITPELLFT